MSLRAPQPDVLLLSGDLADHGLDVEYEVAAGLLSTVTVPLVTCPGNHDVCTRFVHHLGPAESVTDVADYRLIALNSLVDAAEGERIDHGEQPFCVTVCPMGARIFGDLNDPESEVSQLVDQEGATQMLSDLGTKPRVFYIPVNEPGNTTA